MEVKTPMQGGSADVMTDSCPSDIRAVFQDYRSEGAGDAAEADQGTGISLYFSLLGG